VLKRNSNIETDRGFNPEHSQSGFTIVELLVVIVVIGILAAITIVSYAGVTARANAAAGQGAMNAVIAKTTMYNTDGPTNNWPVSYGSLTGAAATTTYYISSGTDFTIASGNVLMSTFRPTFITNDSVDFQLCGTNTAAAATTYATVNVLSGVKVGYWDYSQTPAVEVNTNSVGQVSGNWTNGYAITCYKVGIAEAVMAVAKAIYNETGLYPATAAAINANTALTAKLPSGVVASLVNPTAALTGVNAGNSYVKFECGTAVAATLPCLNSGAGSGGRLTFWDYNTGAVTASPLVFGTATNFAVPAT
jgi:prepilin-type N-terminal cleavage/methylation domain-containing protein